MTKLSLDTAIQKEIKIYQSNRQLYRQASEQLILENFFVTGYGGAFFGMMHMHHPEKKLPIDFKLTAQQSRGIIADTLLDLTDCASRHEYTDLMKSFLAFKHNKEEWHIPVDMSPFPVLPKVQSYSSKDKAIMDYMARNSVINKAIDKADQDCDKTSKTIDIYWHVLKPAYKQLIDAIAPHIIVKTFGYDFPTALIGNHFLLANRKVHQQQSKTRDKE